jgi:hypothetical protein
VDEAVGIIASAYERRTDKPPVATGDEHLGDGDD